MKKLLFFACLTIGNISLEARIFPTASRIRQVASKTLLAAQENVEQAAVTKGLEFLNYVNPENKDEYASGIFNVLKKFRPQLLGAMTDYYHKRFWPAPFGESLNPKPTHIVDEFTHVAAYNLAKIPAQTIEYLLKKNEKTRSLFVEKALENISNINVDIMRLLISPPIDLQGLTINVTSFADQDTQKIISAIKKKFQYIKPSVLLCLLDKFKPELRQDFVELTKSHISKKYGRNYIYKLLCDSGTLDLLTLTVLQYNFNKEFTDQMLPTLQQSFKHIDKETIQALSQNSDSTFISALTENFLTNMNELDTPTIENILKHTSYRSRGRILNALQDNISAMPYQNNMSYIDTLFDRRFNLVNIYNHYTVPLYRPALKQAELPKNLSQTEAHLLVNKNIVREDFGDIIDQEPIQKIIHEIHEREKAEEAQGRLTFFHGCKWQWDLYQELFTKLMEIKTGKLFENYRFLRFEKGYDQAKEQEEIRELLLNKGRITETTHLRPKLFFMNHALFGNTKHKGSCTFNYWYNNNDLSEVEITLKGIFETCGFTEYYDKYRYEIDALEALHTKAENKGTLLLVSIDPKQASNYVYPAFATGIKDSVTTSWFARTSNVNKIIGMLKNNPQKLGSQSDTLEYCMILTNDYALNPDKAGKEIKIYPFHLAQDTQTYNDYCIKRDQLLEKIKRDIIVASSI